MQTVGLEWVEYAISEQTTFRHSVVVTEKSSFQRRYSFPNCPMEFRQLPILQRPLLTSPVNPDYSEFASLVEHGNIGNLTLGKSEGYMRYRSSRAYRLLLKCTGKDVTRDDAYHEFVGEDSSDEEGGLLPAKPKVYPILPKIDPKELAEKSAIEYPREEIDYKRCVVLTLRKQQKFEGQPLFLRPVMKKGMVLRRPAERPKGLDDVVKDPLHYEFFRRYMKIHNSEAPLLFWKSVELLKRTDNPLTRQKKAQQILRKFFSRVAGGGIMLQCDSEIIKAVAAAETVTTSMLIQTSSEVFRSMERNWAERYFSTFPQKETVEEVEKEKKINTRALKTSRAWVLFSDFMRRSARFVKCMKDPRQFAAFGSFLRHIPHRPDSAMKAAGGDASSIAVMFQKYETVVYKHQNTDLEIKHTTKTLFGRTITMNFLINDLAFYLETDRYSALYNNMKFLKRNGSFSWTDREAVDRKAKTIVQCFLESFVPPKVRINVNHEVADNVVKLSQYNVLGNQRALFQEPLWEVFPVLVHYWKIYRLEKFAYVSKKKIRETRHMEAEERRIYINRKIEKRKMKLISKKATRGTQESIKNSDTSLKSFTSFLFPDYVNDLAKLPYEKVKGILYSDPPTLHFSLEQGLKLIVPPKRRIVEKIADKDSNEFLSVWTRGAKVVNVFREGSNPRLVNLEGNRKSFKVKCDMVEG